MGRCRRLEEVQLGPNCAESRLEPVKELPNCRGRRFPRRSRHRTRRGSISQMWSRRPRIVGRPLERRERRPRDGRTGFPDFGGQPPLREVSHSKFAFPSEVPGAATLHFDLAFDERPESLHEGETPPHMHEAALPARIMTVRALGKVLHGSESGVPSRRIVGGGRESRCWMYHRPAACRPVRTW